MRPNGFDDTRTTCSNTSVNKIDKINGPIVIVIISRKINFTALEKCIYSLFKGLSCAIVVSVALRFATVIFPRSGNGNGTINIKCRTEFSHGICNEKVSNATDVMIFVVSLFIQKVIKCGFWVCTCKLYIGELNKNNNPANVSFSKL